MLDFFSTESEYESYRVDIRRSAENGHQWIWGRTNFTINTEDAFNWGPNARNIEMGHFCAFISPRTDFTLKTSYCSTGPLPMLCVIEWDDLPAGIKIFTEIYLRFSSASKY